MRRMLLFAPLAIAACAASGPKRIPSDSVQFGSKCVQSVALDTFKGQVASTELAARIMSAARASKLRWVPFGAVVTMEYNERRVTVRLDRESRVISAICG